ncbi:hypothetical protein HMPREF1624_05907 [Sporothrix schenckii ATCC 58251]|uniref:N-acetyltransferase domain-containing protein n=1 Tax=Sporothrix schenckii (strain ATCC 58251 / de Perez 2211183) TaxID=1391915 RepID=U7PS04_SPOS1|nr:hypothetical protein HMPREF1624_05907 [Sporothrix schenckii ATCC 58251]
MPARASLVPAQWETNVRVIGMSECREAALSLAHAFAADGLSLYLVTSDDTAGFSEEVKWRLHVDIMTYIVAAVCLNGVVTTIGPDYEGVALWMPPGKSLDGFWTILRSGLWRLHFQLSTECRRRYYAELLPLLEHSKVEVMAQRGVVDNSYYLLYLGTKPGARCRGYARKLLEHMLVKADQESRPVYLESSSIANNSYYSRFGFELKRDISLVRGPAPVGLSIMVREPQTVPNTKLDKE